MIGSQCPPTQSFCKYCGFLSKHFFYGLETLDGTKFFIQLVVQCSASARNVKHSSVIMCVSDVGVFSVLSQGANSVFNVSNRTRIENLCSVGRGNISWFTFIHVPASSSCLTWTSHSLDGCSPLSSLPLLSVMFFRNFSSCSVCWMWYVLMDTQGFFFRCGVFFSI